VLEEEEDEDSSIETQFVQYALEEGGGEVFVASILSKYLTWVDDADHHSYYFVMQIDATRAADA
jgi:hypothetical protein